MAKPSKPNGKWPNGKDVGPEKPQESMIPRLLTEIQTEYKDVAFKAGNLQYHMEIMKLELNQLNQRLQQMNQEAAKRGEIDQELKSKETMSETPAIAN